MIDIDAIMQKAEEVRVALDRWTGASRTDDKNQLWKEWDAALTALHDELSPIHATVLELCRLAGIGQNTERNAKLADFDAEAAGFYEEPK